MVPAKQKARYATGLKIGASRRDQTRRTVTKKAYPIQFAEATMWMRRFFCQQASSCSSQIGLSLP
jgi:hypothetical protein